LNYSSLTSLVLFVFVSSITPGPNNVMLLSSGLRFGVRRTVPHILGVSLGHAFLVFCVALGLSQIFLQNPWMHTAIKILGAAYLLYLAYRIVIAPPPDENNSADKPLGFYGAALFQWVNPKGWIMAVGAVAAFLPGNSTLIVLLLFSALFALINLNCATVWTVFGANIRRWLHDPVHLKIFNWIMGLLLVISLIPMLNE
jgi:threonine/homoserine/homoserine lactone efflux protein